MLVSNGSLTCYVLSRAGIDPTAPLNKHAARVEKVSNSSSLVKVSVDIKAIAAPVTLITRDSSDTLAASSSCTTLSLARSRLPSNDSLATTASSSSGPATPSTSISNVDLIHTGQSASPTKKGRGGPRPEVGRGLDSPLRLNRLRFPSSTSDASLLTPHTSPSATKAITQDPNVAVDVDELQAMYEAMLAAYEAKQALREDPVVGGVYPFAEARTEKLREAFYWDPEAYHAGRAQ